MASPRPVPWIARFWDVEERKDFVNSCAYSSLGIPMPVSVTVMTASSRSRVNAHPMDPPLLGERQRVAQQVEHHPLKALRMANSSDSIDRGAELVAHRRHELALGTVELLEAAYRLDLPLEPGGQVVADRLLFGDVVGDAEIADHLPGRVGHRHHHHGGGEPLTAPANQRPVLRPW